MSLLQWVCVNFLRMDFLVNDSWRLTNCLKNLEGIFDLFVGLWTYMIWMLMQGRMKRYEYESMNLFFWNSFKENFHIWVSWVICVVYLLFCLKDCLCCDIIFGMIAFLAIVLLPRLCHFERRFKRLLQHVNKWLNKLIFDIFLPFFSIS